MEAENQGPGSSINEQEQQQQQQRQQQAHEDAARLQEARDQFRRSLSSLNKNKASPTRTLRLTAHEQQQSSLSRGDGTPIRYTREELFRRPRSNPRSRTPMRYESPLEDNAFTRQPQPQQQPPQQQQRITIRPGAGSAVGAATVFGNSIHERPVTPKSGKQGPSHRKIRRWNNDKFTRLASEIASSNKKAADVLLKAHSEAHLFRDIYDPKDHQPSKEIKEFMQGDAFKESREKFFDGAGPRPASLLNQRRRPKEFKDWTAGERMNLIDPRLRSVVVRACRNSYAASKVVELLEDCVVSTFRGDDDWIMIPTAASSSDDDDNNKNKMWWQGLLLQSPTVTKSIDEDAREQEGVLLRTRYQVQFLFDAETPTGGFHRLLLQAICQFHGLRTVSRMLHGAPTVDGTSISEARVLTATGCLKHERAQNIRLLNHLSNDHELSHPQRNATSSLTKEMAILKV